MRNLACIAPLWLLLACDGSPRPTGRVQAVGDADAGVIDGGAGTWTARIGGPWRSLRGFPGGGYIPIDPIKIQPEPGFATIDVWQLSPMGVAVPADGCCWGPESAQAILQFVGGIGGQVVLSIDTTSDPLGFSQSPPAYGPVRAYIASPEHPDVALDLIKAGHVFLSASAQGPSSELDHDHARRATYEAAIAPPLRDHLGLFSCPAADINFVGCW